MGDNPRMGRLFWRKKGKMIQNKEKNMTGMLTLEALTQAVSEGRIDTVLVCFADMQGRLIGKRFSAQFFVDGGYKETHACDYLLSNDMEMELVPGYAASGWDKGYGDFALAPDLSTLRETPWLEGTALVLCDVLNHHSGEAIPISPRAILKAQLTRLEAMGFSAMMATELEFYLFNETYNDARDKHYQGLQTSGRYIEDYHIFQSSKEEPLIRAMRNGLQGAGIMVENSKGEWGPGQQELNVRYADALTMADNHVIMKNAMKEMAHAQGRAITFMPKWHNDLAGNSCHIHMSLWDRDAKQAMFLDKNSDYGMSEVMHQFMAGLLHHASDMMVFLAPMVNSYKRFCAESFAPTRIVWSRDNRTAGFRLVGENTRAIRCECRIGGGDLNPYLAMAALLAAGMDGMEKAMKLAPGFVGDAYGDDDLRAVPSTLPEATNRLDGSSMLRAAFGDAVVDHYVHGARWEQSRAERAVTDWDLKRGFEQS
jgi:glutamine synthetase